MSTSKRQSSGEVRGKLGKLLGCLCSGEQLRPSIVEMGPSSEPNEIVNSKSSSPASETGRKLDAGDIEEAETSLREAGRLNSEEARALFGRYEYQKGNIEAALQVFEGIDVASVTPKIKYALTRTAKHQKKSSQHISVTAMSIKTASFILEAMFLKAKSLEALGRFSEAAQCCQVILDILESSFPEGLPENFGADCKLQETASKAVGLLPELWKLAECPHETSMSYRQALLHQWNLDPENNARIQKEFAMFLLYSGYEASPPSLQFQIEGSFVPKNNIEEAILLLMIVLRKMSLKRIQWDPSIMDHLSFALSISGGLGALGIQIEELDPSIIDEKELHRILALCYCGASQNPVSLDLLRKLLRSRENSVSASAMLLAAKICAENDILANEGLGYAHRAIERLKDSCSHQKSSAYCLLGILLSAYSRTAVSNSDRMSRQSEALEALETAGKLSRFMDANVIYHLCLETAEQRKLDDALFYAKYLLKLEAGSNLRAWLLLAQLLSSKKLFLDAAGVVNTALDQVGTYEQGELLRTKAKLQNAQGLLQSAIGTYIELLAILHVQNKNFSTKKLGKGKLDSTKKLESLTWNDLTHLYITLSRWHDAEICLSRWEAIDPQSASRYHTTGVLNKSRGLHKEALNAFMSALAIDPTHVPSLVSVAELIRHQGNHSHAVIRSFLMEALKLDPMNPCAWYNLGLLYQDLGTASSLCEATDCFETAAFLEETAPVEPFR